MFEFVRCVHDDAAGTNADVVPDDRASTIEKRERPIMVLDALYYQTSRTISKFAAGRPGGSVGRAGSQRVEGAVIKTLLWNGFSPDTFKNSDIFVWGQIISGLLLSNVCPLRIWIFCKRAGSGREVTTLMKHKPGWSAGRLVLVAV